MVFKKQLIQGFLIKRYKRFLADVELKSGEIVTAHCPNSGSMKTCIGDRWKVMLSESDNPKRKLRYTLEMIHNGKCWIGINTQYPNKIVKDAIMNHEIKELNYKFCKPEVKTSTHTRLDLKLWNNDDDVCFVEIKNCTLLLENKYQFPDAVTTRGQKHIDELLTLKKKGYRAVLFFLIQRNDGEFFTPASSIDPVYSKKLTEAKKNGVEILAYRANVSPQKIEIVEQITVRI